MIKRTDKDDCYTCKHLVIKWQEESCPLDSKCLDAGAFPEWEPKDSPEEMAEMRKELEETHPMEQPEPLGRKE